MFLNVSYTTILLLIIVVFVLIVLKLMVHLENLTLKRKLGPKSGIDLFPSTMKSISLKSIKLFIISSFVLLTELELNPVLHQAPKHAGRNKEGTG